VPATEMHPCPSNLSPIPTIAGISRQPDSFVGRPDELRYFKECILHPTILDNMSPSRLGGVGKSTLLDQFISLAKATGAEEDAPRCS